MKLRDLHKLLLPKAMPLHEIGMIKLGKKDIPFTVVRNKRRKRTIAFTIDPDASLRIMAPLRTRMPVIHAMLQSREAWILQKLAEHKKIQQISMPRRFIDGESILFLGHQCKLQITQDVTKPQGCLLRRRRLLVNIADAQLSIEVLQHEVRLEILLWIKKRAKITLQKRMDLWAAALGLTYKKLLVTGPARQWGSCTVDNVIRLNWRLMMAPLPLIDYVVAHELSHVVHKNHSARFWGYMEKAMPDYQARRKQLRQMGSGFVL